MSNETKVGVYKRLWKLWAMICKMVMDGVRDPEKVADLLQTIVDGVAEVKVYLKRLFAKEVINFGNVTIVIYELAKNATFQQMFGDIGEKRRYWKNKEEALVFATKHKDKLGPNGNFFEMEGGLVAFVDVSDDGPPDIYHVCKLSHDDVWPAGYGHRVFYPQK